MKTSHQHDDRHSRQRLPLPHERDESPDSQAAGARTRIRQAARDVEAGQLDTDARASPGVECVEDSGVQKGTRPHLKDADPGATNPGADPASKSGA
jgi:hypothetical protein